ncbi:hypothetical protein MXL97_09030, partial [Mammaliicoccus fleurettii]|uniref:hypothetical protein n=1 Tax=Mammaliicoccus fleurettii TaxID=150056 RepID=UPI002DBF6D09
TICCLNSLLYSLRSLLIKRPPTFLILTILLFKEVVQLSVDGPTQVYRSVSKSIYIHTSR